MRLGLLFTSALYPFLIRAPKSDHMGETKQTYSEKLKSPLWQRKRLQVYERDNWTCVLCSDNATELHVHHKSYQPGKEPWEYELDNFSTLCKHCHAAVTIYKKEFTGDILKASKRRVPLLGYYALLLLVRKGDERLVVVLTTDDTHMDIISVLSQEAVEDINALMKTEITDPKTL